MLFRNQVWAAESAISTIYLSSTLTEVCEVVGDSSGNTAAYPIPMIELTKKLWHTTKNKSLFANPIAQPLH